MSADVSPVQLEVTTLVVASSGTPADPQLASANPAQSIGIVMPWAAAASRMTFPVTDASGSVSSRTITPWSIDSVANVASFIVPNDALTGTVSMFDVGVPAVTQDFLLQIVPVIRGLDYSLVVSDGSTAGVTLSGRGFIEGQNTTYRFGTQSIIDSSPSLFPDVTNDFSANISNGRASMNVPLTPETFGPVVVQTAGGTSAPFTVGFTGLTSTAVSGTPADAGLPSANPGQAIVVTGSGLTTGTDFIVRYIDSGGLSRAAVINPVSADLDGTRATLVVPTYANSVFPLRALGASFTPQLQIVPALSSFDVIGTAAVRLLGAGFVEGDATYQTGGTVVIDTATNDGPNVSLTTLDNRMVELTLKVHGFGALQVTTDGGTSEPLNLNFLSPGFGNTLYGSLREVLHDSVNDRLGIIEGPNGFVVRWIDSATGQTTDDYPVPDSFAGIQVLPTGMTLHNSSTGSDVAVPAGSLLFVNGLANPDRIEAVTPGGAVYAVLTLPVDYDAEAVAYDEGTGHVFLLSSNQTPDQIYEIDPLTGNALGSFLLPFDIAVGGAGMAIEPGTGNFWITTAPLRALNQIAVVMRAGPEAGSVRRVSLAFQGIDSFEITGLAFSNSNELLVSSTQGVIYRVDLNTLNTVGAPAPVLVAINALAMDGTPAEPTLASANVGQVVELFGSNFRMSDLQVQFAARDNGGNSFTVAATPIMVSDDGSRALVQVPDQAETGIVNVTGRGSRNLTIDGSSDAVYRDITLAFSPSTTAVQIQFSDTGLQGVSDESWGLDNVRVALGATPDDFTFLDRFEGGASGLWSSPVTDMPGPGTLTQFSGRFSNQTQTLNLSGLTPGQEYQLTFDLYILDSWEGTSPTSGPDFLDVVIDGTLRFHEAFANAPSFAPSADSRAVQTFGANGNVPLQIVPVLTGTRLSPVVELLGSGFMESASILTIGGIEFMDSYANLAGFDVTGTRNDTYRTTTLIALDGPIRITTAGGFHEIPGSTLPAPAGPVNFTGIQAVTAARGTPADPQLPSVNTGQRIVLEGQGFNFQTMVLFEAADDTGMHGTVMRSGTPGPSGLTLSVEVPALARTGMVRVVGDDESFPLQVVPLLRAAGGTLASGSTIILEGTGLVKDELLVRIDGIQAAVEEFQTISDQKDVSATPGGDITRHQHLLKLVVPAGISDGVISVDTDGGSATLQGSSLTGITALALSGTAAMQGAASANTGQTIILHGTGLTPIDRVVFTNVVSEANVQVAPHTVAADGTSLEVVVPNNAITGMVRLLRDTTGVFLQIVPTLTDVDLGANESLHGGGLRLAGSGFADRFLSVHFGAQTFTNGRDGTINASNNEFLLTVPNGVPPGPIRVSTPGGTSETFSLTFTGLQGTAASGTPADPGRASANPGQTITLQGTGMDMTSDVVFPVIGSSGTPSELVVRPVFVSADGTNITVIVPAGAITGTVAIVGDQNSSSFLLQIVPVVTSIDVGSIFSGLTVPVTLTGRGFVEGQNTLYRFGTEAIVDRSILTGPDMTGYLATGESRTTLNVPLTNGAFGAITVETAGGISAPFTIGFSGITSVAFNGTAANTSLASANPGQAITVTGSGLTAGSDFILRYLDNTGAARAVVINPVIADLDGSSATLIVPNYANGAFPLGVFGSSFLPQLQIVPILKSFGVLPLGTNTLRLLGRGFVEGDTIYEIGGQTIIDTSIDNGPGVFSINFDNDGADLVVSMHGLGLVQVTTDGGTSAALNLNLLTPGLGVTPGYVWDVAYDAVNARLWAVGNTKVYQIDPATGQSLSSFDVSIPVFGVPTSFQGGIHALVTEMVLRDSSSGMNVSVPAGSLLFVNANATPDRIVAVSPSGMRIASLTLNGNYDGEALVYDDASGHVFLLSSNQTPDRIFEIDPLTGNAVGSLPIPVDVSLGGGGMTMDPVTGNLLIGSSSITEALEVVKSGPAAGSVQRRVSLALEGIGFSEVSGLAFRSPAELYVSSQRGVIYSVDPAPAAITPLPAPVVTSINALAVDGTPTDAAFASANIGQVIELTGSNLRLGDLQIQFAVRDNSGVSSITSVAPLAVNTDGTRAQVQVPNLAETGIVKVVAVGGRHLGFSTFTDNARDAVYRNLTLDFVATGGATQIEFLDSGLQGVFSESWGLDNVRVALSSTPSTFILEDTFEGGASGVWSSLTTDSTHLGVFSQFSGRFSNQSQTLNLTGLTAGQSYQLTFDLYIIDLWSGLLATNAPDYFDVFIDGTRRFHEAFSNSILPGAVQTFGASGNAVLQIVPVITGVPLGRPGTENVPGQPFQLKGSGFMEAASTITIGGISFPDPYPNLFDFDVIGDRNDTLMLETPLSLDGPIRVTTAGGFHEISGPPYTAPLVIGFTGILAQALGGTPTDAQLPSANTGQRITLQGYGFDSKTLVQFAATDSTGAVGTVTRTGIAGAGGTTLTVEVPALARTGMVRVVGDDAAFLLQIVPTLRSTGGTMLPGTQLVLEGTGLVEDQLTVSIDGILAQVMTVETIIDGKPPSNSDDLRGDQQIAVVIVPIGISRGVITASTGGGNAILDPVASIVSLPTLNPAADVGDSMASSLDVMVPINSHIDVSQSIGDGLFGDRDVDLYRFSADAFDVLRVSMTRLQPSDASSRVRVFDSAGNVLTGDVSSGPGLTPFLRYFLPANGTYFLGVSSSLNGAYDPAVEGSGNAGDTGSYQLSVTLSRGTTLTGIASAAASGTATFSDVASANIGQTITLQGVGFLSTDTVTFTAITDSGLLTVSSVAPLTVAPDGMNLTVVVPNAATTGNVRLTRESNGMFLQIVPMVTDVDHGSGLKLIGRGFVESATAVHFDTQILKDTGKIVGIDVANGAIGFPTISNSLLILQLPAGVPLGPLRVTTPGGTSAPFNLTFTGIVATAASGSPANPSEASANPGQTITLQGSGLDMTTDVVFQIIDPNGLRTQRIVRPVSVNGNGTEISVLVPNDANGAFPLQISGAAFSPLLQIVPLLSAIDVPFMNVVRISGSGFVEGATNYQFAGTLLRDLAKSGTIDVSLGNSTVDISPRPGHGFGTLVVSTEGGTSAPLAPNFMSPSTNGVLTGYLKDVAYDAVNDRIWVVTDQSPPQLRQINPATGATLSSLIMSSGAFAIPLLAGVQVLPSEIPSLGGVAVPAGSLLFFHGSASPDRIVAIDSAGILIASLTLTELDVVGGAYDPATDRLYLLDGAPDQVLVVNPANGSVESTFAVPIDVTNGGIAILPMTGNLWIASSSSTNLVEMTKAGAQARQFSLTPLGIGFELTGLAWKNENELLASSTLGVVYVINPDALVSVPVIAINDVTISEGNSGTTTATFTVTRSGSTSSTSTVNVQTASSTATSAADYLAAQTTLTFLPGEAIKTVDVIVNGDTTFENTEAFFVNLTNPINASISDAQGVGTITNDDTAPSFAINDVQVTEGNSLTTTATFTVTKTGATELVSSVQVQTGNGAAVAGSDYVALQTTLTFLPGETIKTVDVIVNGDTTFENTEAFFVNLTNPTNASVSDAQGVGTITNDDTAPSFAINDVQVTEGNSATATATFTVTKTGATELASSVQVQTGNGTAVADSDYVALPVTPLTFAPVELTKTVAITINGDTTFELDESFVVTLSNALNATILDAQSIGTILNDDQLNSTPIASNDVATTDLHVPVTIKVLANDSDDAPVIPSSVSIESGPANGSVTVDATTGNVTYTPDLGFFGTDQFTYSIRDDRNAVSNLATVTVTVLHDSTEPLTVLVRDPSDPSKTVLVVMGTDGDDVIHILRHGSSGLIKVMVRGIEQRLLGPASVLIFALDGRNNIKVQKDIGVPVAIVQGQATVNGLTPNLVEAAIQGLGKFQSIALPPVNPLSYQYRPSFPSPFARIQVAQLQIVENTLFLNSYRPVPLTIYALSSSQNEFIRLDVAGPIPFSRSSISAEFSLLSFVSPSSIKRMQWTTGPTPYSYNQWWKLRTL